MQQIHEPTNSQPPATPSGADTAVWLAYAPTSGWVSGEARQAPGSGSITCSGRGRASSDGPVEGAEALKGGCARSVTEASNALSRHRRPL
jgi:hypothetical protein